MAKAGAQASGVAERYATALFALAGDKGLHDSIAADLNAFAGMMTQSAELRDLMHSPLYTREVQAKTVVAVAKKAAMTDLFCRFVGTLAKSRRLASLSEIAEAYRRMLAELRGEHQADVVSAAPLRAGQIEALKERLAHKLGGSVSLHTVVDPEILGGLVVKIGSRMIDSSLRGKLERIGFLMKGTV